MKAKKYSLYVVILGIFLVLTLVSLVSIYSTVSLHRQDLLETAVEEKTRLASTISETIISPLWFYRAAKVPGLEKTFIGEMSRIGEVRYIRIVRIDGSISQSSIAGEAGRTIDDPAIGKALTTRETVIRDEVFKGEEVKTIIYPGYRDETIWVAFSLARAEAATRDILTRGITTAGVQLIFILLTLLLVLRIIINPIKKITAACQEIRKGNLDIKIPETYSAEIGELTTVFNKTTEELKESRTALKDLNTVLEIKVEARTKELKELTDSQEKMIQDRTKELQERVNELEKFHMLTVGRELKMVELKEEIEKLKKELERSTPELKENKDIE